MTGTWPAGWATGDVVIAAEFKKGIGSISDTTLGGSAANIDITSISATYAHLLAVVYARSDGAVSHAPLRVQFNGDTAANYDSQRLLGFGTTVQAAENFAITAMIPGEVPDSTAAANLFGVTIIFIPHYAGSTNNKLALAITAAKEGTTTGLMQNYAIGGFWRSNAAINRITFLPNTGNFVTGTRVTLYGMGA